ncbi:MAG: hypothetical protein ACRCUF_08995, partial [Aeromonas sobria]
PWSWVSGSVPARSSEVGGAGCVGPGVGWLGLSDGVAPDPLPLPELPPLAVPPVVPGLLPLPVSGVVGCWLLPVPPLLLVLFPA